VLERHRAAPLRATAPAAGRYCSGSGTRRQGVNPRFLDGSAGIVTSGVTLTKKGRFEFADWTLPTSTRAQATATIIVAGPSIGFSRFGEIFCDGDKDVFGRKAPGYGQAPGLSPVVHFGGGGEGMVTGVWIQPRGVVLV
jgi:hypothetical protein